MFLHLYNNALSLGEDRFMQYRIRDDSMIMRVYPKVPGLVAWSENCKRYSSLSRGGGGASLFFESV